MVALDSRARDILLAILHADSPLSTPDIAAQLSTTPRMVQYALRSVEQWLNRKGVSLEKKTGVGVFINLPHTEKRELAREVEFISGYQLILSPIERVRYLTIALLTDEQPILVKSIAPKLGVSRPTVFNDLDTVETWLADHGLKLIRKPGFGFQVDGSELNIRKGIESAIVESIGQMSLLALYQGKSNSVIMNNEWERGMRKSGTFNIETLELEVCSELVAKTEELSHFSFTDSSFLEMALFFGILMFRTKQGHILKEFSVPVPDFYATKEFTIAKQLSQLIEEKHHLKLEQAEISNIAAHILSTKARQTLSNTTLTSNLIMKDEEIEQTIRAMIQEAAKLLHPILNIDQQLKQGLLFHIKPVLNRLYFGLPIHNFLLEEIKKQYPYIFMVAEKTSKILESRLGRRVPESEIGFLAMHFGAAMERLRTFSSPRKRVLVVCGGGCATAWLLVSRMRAEFPELDVIDVQSAMDFANKKISPPEADLIITTIPLEKQKTPIIVVNPLLNDVDKSKIRGALGMDAVKTGVSERVEFVKGHSIASLIVDETIQFGKKTNSWQEAVEISCQPLLKNGAIEDRYVSAIKDLLHQHGPYMVLSSGVVLLHAMSGFGVKFVCMSLTTFSQPVKFGHKYNDPVFLAIVFGATDNHSHLKALIQLSKLIGDQNLMQEVKTAPNRETLLAVLYRAIGAE